MKIYSATLHGVTPLRVEIEIDLSGGLPFFQIVGLPDAILRESKTRVKSAIIQSGFDFPYDSRLVLNLSPSKIKKEGSAFELALAARILISSNQISSCNGDVLFLGELGLDGSIRSVDGIEALSFALDDAKVLVVPFEDVERVRRFTSCSVVGLRHLRDLNSDWWMSTLRYKNSQNFSSENFNRAIGDEIASLRVSPFWARHLEIAATGRHHYLLCGPPGTGKTFFAESLRLLSSALRDANENTRRAIDAVFGRESGEIPWAAPHHGVTEAGLLGGGGIPKPGAMTRAHGGILFLDELLEFSPTVLDSLREPLERRQIEIFRSGAMTTFPSDVQLLAATNPCRCGYWGHPWQNCTCFPSHRKAYQAKISGPFFDRFDARVFCPPALQHESEVKGSQILTRLKNSLVKRKDAALVSRLSKDFDSLSPNLVRRVGSRRIFESLRRLSVTLALIDSTPVMKNSHIEEALSLQKLKELESLC